MAFNGGSPDSNNPIPYPLQAELGVQRDGTRFKAKAFLRSQWTRYYNGYPEKMGGTEMIDLGNDEIVRNMYDVPKSEGTDIYLGKGSSLSYFSIGNDGTITSEINRTPASDFTPNEDNIWSFSLLSLNSNEAYVYAQVAPNVNNLSSQTNGPLFVGSIYNNSPFTPVADNPPPF